MEDTFTGELMALQTLIDGLIAGFVLIRCLIILSDARSNEQPISAALEQCKKIVKAGIIAIFIPEYIKIISGFGFFTGTDSTEELSNQICKVLKITAEVFTALSSTLTTFNVAKELVAMNAAPTENKPYHKEKIKKILVVGLITVCASGLLIAVFGYFAVPVDEL